MPTAHWSLISASTRAPRSSHALTVIPSSPARLLLFGGERTPRVPVDGALRALSLPTAPTPTPAPTASTEWAALTSSSHTDAPSARVGATLVWDAPSASVYLWGGRGGVDMAPLTHPDVGVWRGTPASGSDTKVSWARIAATNEGEAPEPRSYHAAVCAEGKLYIHAGCPASGRLSTLYSFDIPTRTWATLATAPGPPRGGTSLAAVALPRGTTSQLHILRFGGFAGYELGGPQDPTVDIYDPRANTWHSVTPAPDAVHGRPGARSVGGFVPFGIGAGAGSQPSVGAGGKGKVPVALLYHGEREPSSEGHAGAGEFWDDVWVLRVSPGSNTGTLTSDEWQWEKVDVPAGGPEGRGWLPGASYEVDLEQEKGTRTRAVLSGGLLSSNERSDELWVLDVNVE